MRHLRARSRTPKLVPRNSPGYVPLEYSSVRAARWRQFFRDGIPTDPEMENIKLWGDRWYRFKLGLVMVLLAFALFANVNLARDRYERSKPPKRIEIKQFVPKTPNVLERMTSEQG